jgi:NADH-quinone oxidoreductase subunit N
VGLALMLVGFGFKISAVPFHMWVPDVYQGAPTSVTTLIATGSKAAAFAALMRLLLGSVKGAQADWMPLVWSLAVVTMTLGNVVAIAQSNLKRMLAYSSVAHVGYMMIGLVVGGANGASAILLFGIAWVYGLTGTTNVAGIAAAVDGTMSGALLVAIGFLTVGGTFKIAAVPFHYWTPDAYQGAPTPITGFLSAGPKLGAFALLIRIFADALAPLRADWLAIFLILTVLTMTVGNVVALTQVNVKRMLAYSSIAHTGYIMAGLAAFASADDQRVAARGIEAVLFYVLGYAVMNIAAFAVVAMLQRDTGRFGGLNSSRGHASRAPWRAGAMAILMLSLTGIPPTVGFFAKLYVLLAAVEANLARLAVVIVLNAALGAFYYLRVIVYMYMREPDENTARWAPSFAGGVALVIAAVGIVVLGVMPAPFAELAQAAVAPLVR